LGNYSRGLEFLQLDRGSDWASRNIVTHFIQAGTLAQAREQSEKSGDNGIARMTRECLHNAPVADVDQLARQLAPGVFANPDAENRYLIASNFAFCGQKDIALRLLKSSVEGGEGNYCAYTALQTDPTLAKLRGTPEFNELLSAAKKCQSDFLAQRSQAAP
jgi:hypothetical protein